MRKTIESVINRYGITVEVWHLGVSYWTKAFFQPIKAKSAKMISTPLGMAPQGDYQYMGPADLEIQADDGIVIDGAEYLVTRAEEIRDEQGVVYRWAVCKRKGGMDTWVRPI